MVSKNLFISYGHKDMVDENWLERLKLHLGSVSRRGLLDPWDDTRIKAGANWLSEIKAALDRAAAAVLLVGPGFLASEFIATEELLPLLTAAQNRGVKIYPLVVGYCQYKSSALTHLQAFNDPGNPLESLSKPGQNKLLSELSGEIEREMLLPAPQGQPSAKAPAPSDWRNERRKEYERTDGYMLTHVYRPSVDPIQRFSIFIFIVRHLKDTPGPPKRSFDEIEKAEFFFGESWGNKVFRVENTGGLIGVRTDAWGTFLAACRITMSKPKGKTIMLFRYIDFEMGEASFEEAQASDSLLIGRDSNTRLGYPSPVQKPKKNVPN
jgi:hypothetical protein